MPKAKTYTFFCMVNGITCGLSQLAAITTIEVKKAELHLDKIIKLPAGENLDLCIDTDPHGSKCSNLNNRK